MEESLEAPQLTPLTVRKQVEFFIAPSHSQTQKHKTPKTLQKGSDGIVGSRNRGSSLGLVTDDVNSELSSVT